MKKGFTLIELLAVIVILAIIVLIAVPIVRLIIEDSKKSSHLISAEHYLDAVEVEVANRVMNYGKIQDSTYHILENGNICLEEYDSSKKLCKDNDNNLNNNELIVLVSGEHPNGGSIVITDGKIRNVSLNIGKEVIVKNDDNKLIYSSSPCKLIEGEANTIGSKYQCKVKNKMENGYKKGYYFYVLSFNEDGTTNLIMNRNIYYDENNDVGKVATSDNPGLVAWRSSGGTKNSVGPNAAMNYLHNATKDWTNIPNIIMNYEDENVSPATGLKGTSGYGGIKTIENTTIITNLSGVETLKLENLKTRLPRYNEIHGEGKCLSYAENDNKFGSCPLWLVNYLAEYKSLYKEISAINKISGYWSISSASNAATAIDVKATGVINNDNVTYGNTCGVRPVITLKL